MNNDIIQELINSAGAMAEMMRIHYEAFVAAGFDDHQAMYLCGKLFEAFLTFRNQEEDE